MVKRIGFGTDSSGRAVLFDPRMAHKMRLLQQRFPKVVIVQGSFSDADASAGVHKGGGTVDLRTWNLTAAERNEVVRYMREVLGIVAWYRTKAQGFDPHIHGVDAGNPHLAPGAARQVASFRSGRNGLASNGKDDGPRVQLGSVDTSGPVKPRPAAPALGTYSTRRRTNKRAESRAAAKVLSTLPAGATVKIREVHYDPIQGVWFGRYRTSLGNKRWIPMRAADVRKK